MKLQFTVSGMTCSACSARVERCVKAVDGVDKCAVNLITGALTVEASEDVSEKIEAAIKKEGYGVKRGVSVKRSDEREKSLLKRLVISVPLVLSLMYIAMGSMMGAPLPSFMTGDDGMVAFALSQALIALAVIVVNNAYFRIGFKNLFSLKPNMDSLVAVGSAASFLYGVYAVVAIWVGTVNGDNELVHSLAHNLYFEGAAMILALITVGKYLEEKSKNKTMSSIEKLLGLAPDSATILEDGVEKVVKIGHLKIGNVVILKDGDKIPCDGKIISGFGWIDQSAITGESIPVYKEEGETLVCGTVFSGGYAKMEATSVGEDTTLYKIVKLVEDANSTKVPIARLADKISGVFTPAVMIIALVAFVVNALVTKEISVAFNAAVSVLVVSCPCALGLATPAALMSGTGKAAEYGILIKSGEALQKTASVDAIVLDKTGTITFGKPQVDGIVLADGVERSEFLSTAASLEKMSSHVLGAPVVALAESEGVDICDVEDFEAVKGFGIKGSINGKNCRIGNLKYVLENEPSERGAAVVKESESALGATLLFLSINGEITGYISIKDGIKPSSKAAVESLKRMGKRVIMLTGDNRSSAKAVADELGVEFEAETLPDRKYQVIEELKSEGLTTMMVGDGVNDAPALTAADVGVAIGAGTDIAVESADVALIKSDLTDVAKLLTIGKKTMLNIKENLFWAFFYNILLIPIACGSLSAFGVTLNPMIASLAMSLSSVCVVGNALRLRLIKFDEGGIKKKTNGDRNKKSDRPKNKKGDKKMKKAKAEITINGMMCEHCSKRVEEALSGLGLKVEINLKKKKAFVLEGEVDKASVKKIIEEAGYEVVSIEE